MSEVTGDVDVVDDARRGGGCASGSINHLLQSKFILDRVENRQEGVTRRG